jgi:tetratricopeptide (TPR) repeat protein
MLDVALSSEIEAAKASYHTGQYREGLERLKYFWNYEQPAVMPECNNLSLREYAGMLLCCGVLYGYYGYYKSPQTDERIPRNLIFKAYEIFCDLKMEEQIMFCSGFLAISFRRTGDTEEARWWLKRVFEADFHYTHIAYCRAYLTESLIDISEGKYKETLSKLTLLKPCFENLRIDYYLGMYFSQTGTAKKHLGMQYLDEYILAREYYMHANHKLYSLFADNNLAVLYNSAGDEKKANYHADCALAFADEIGEKHLVGGLFDTKALIALKAERYEEALMFAEKAISALRGTSNHSQLVEYINTKIQILIAKDDYDAAEEVCAEAEALLPKCPEPIRDSFSELTIGLAKSLKTPTPEINKLRFAVSPKETIELENVRSNRHLHLGLKKGYFVVIEKVQARSGDFVAVFNKTCKWCNFGFYSECNGLISLESGGEENPHIFGLADVERLGKVIGFVTGEKDIDGYFNVIPFNPEGTY